MFQATRPLLATLSLPEVDPGISRRKPIRVSAWTNDWDKAEAKAREMEHPSLPTNRLIPIPTQPALAEVGNDSPRVSSEWINKNPARLLKPIKVNRVPTGYYTRDEFARIIDATYAYGNWKGGHDFQHRGIRLRALLLLMRWGGLAITDAVTLERDKLTADGKLFLYRAKTGTPVYVPLPAEVAQMLREIPNSNPRYFFWTGLGERENAKKSWDKSLRRLFKTANLREPDGAPKRCTDGVRLSARC